MNDLIELALREDLAGTGDVTSRAVFTDEKDSFLLISKDEGILCGCSLWSEVFDRLDPSVETKFLFKDGDRISRGDCIAEISGRVLSVLTAERTALNFISFLSGIASKAALYAAEAAGSGTVILDTRKTLPGYRELAKYAVRCGGAENHRMGLYDMIMIKDNHADAAGGISAAVKKTREKWGGTYRIEVEARTLGEVREALECGADRIMFDNMDIETMKQAADIVAGKAETEASGNMTLERIREVCSTGVDYISVGDITHSVKAFDFSLRRGSLQEHK